MITKSKVPQIRFHGYNEKWEFDTVGKFYNFKNGLNKGKEFFGYGTPIVNFTDVFHNRSIISNNLKGKVSLTPDEIANYNVEQGDIFFTRTSETIDEIGYPAVMTDSPTNTVYSGFVLRARAINIDPMTLGFKQYVFFTDAFRSEMVKKSSMTTRALTSGTAIKQMFFTFPKDKDEQTKIGNYFQQLDKLIEQKEKKYQKLKQLKKAMLDKMFPKNGADTPEIRFKGFSGKWEKKKLGDIFNYERPDNYIVKSTEYSNDNKIPVLTANKAFILGYTNELSTFNKPSIVFDDFTLDFKFVDFPYMVKSSALKILTINDDEKDSLIFIYNLLNTIKIEIMGHARHYIGVVQPTNVFVPNIEEQEKIGNYFQKLDKQIDLQIKEIEKLKNIKKASLNKMFV